MTPESAREGEIALCGALRTLAAHHGVAPGLGFMPMRGESLGYWGSRSEALLCPIPLYLFLNFCSHSDCVSE